MALLDPLPAAPLTAPTAPSGVLPEQRVVVRHLPERRRFVLEVGVRAAGFAEYFETAGRRVFVHTEVGQAFSGRGLAALLLRRAVETTTADGLAVGAVCPFARRWLAARGSLETD